MVAYLIRGAHGSIVVNAIVPLGLASYTLPLCTNIIVTTLIVVRIYNLTRNTKSASKFRLRSVVYILLESGVLYALVQLVFVTLYAIQHPAQYILVPMAVQVYVRCILSLSPRALTRLETVRFAFGQGIASILVIVHAGFSVTPNTYPTTTPTDRDVLTSWSQLLPNRTQSTYLTSNGIPSIPGRGAGSAFLAYTTSPQHLAISELPVSDL